MLDKVMFFQMTSNKTASNFSASFVHKKYPFATFLKIEEQAYYHRNPHYKDMQLSILI